jgi:hypothetical protein
MTKTENAILIPQPRERICFLSAAREEVAALNERGVNIHATIEGH